MAFIGHVLLLGGRPDDAIPRLERSIRHCHVYRKPLSHVRAHLWLGQAKEQKSDKPGACAAYRVVLDRWDKAKPRSVTADEARARVKALGCGP